MKLSKSTAHFMIMCNIFLITNGHIKIDHRNDVVRSSSDTTKSKRKERKEETTMPKEGTPRPRGVRPPDTVPNPKHKE